MNFKLVFKSFSDAILIDANVLVTIRASMFMIKSNTMKQLMSHLPFGKAIIADLNYLGAVLFPNMGKAAIFSWIVLNQDFVNILWSCWSVTEIICFIKWAPIVKMFLSPDFEAATHFTIHC